MLHVRPQRPQRACRAHKTASAHLLPLDSRARSQPPSNCWSPATSMSDEALAPAAHRLPPELVHRIAALAIGRQCCELCSTARDDYNAQVTHVCFKRTAPAVGIRRRVQQCRSLQSLSLARCATSVTDAWLIELLQELTTRGDGRPRIDLRGCRALTPRVMPLLRAYGRWSAPVLGAHDDHSSAVHSCTTSAHLTTWNLYEPHASLSAEDSVVLQLQAIRDASARSVYPADPAQERSLAFCFDFCRHSWEADHFPRFCRMVRSAIFQPLFHCASFSLQSADDYFGDEPDGASSSSRTFLVFAVLGAARTTKVGAGHHISFAAEDDGTRMGYRWRVSKQPADGRPHAGCWMTDSVMWEARVADET